MSINQEFGELRSVPYGISGDFSIGHESGNKASRQALLAQQAIFDALLTRQDAGLTTPDEDAYITQRMASQVAQDYN
jgi:hypothetical protein